MEETTSYYNRSIFELPILRYRELCSSNFFRKVKFQDLLIIILKSF